MCGARRGDQVATEFDAELFASRYHVFSSSPFPPPAPVRDAQCVKTKFDTGLFARHHQFFCFSCFLSSPCG